MPNLNFARVTVLVAAICFLAPPASAQLLPTDVNTTVNGYQDDFDGAALNPDWSVHGANVFSVSDGMLRVGSASGDPNHLLYEAAGYNSSVQEILARIRVLNFGSGDGPRGGLSTAVDPASSQGINLHFRDEPNPGQRHFEFLDDLRAWGPEFAFNWQNNTWYWLRLRHEPNAPSLGGVNDVFAKIWLADGSQAEPASWQMTWNYSPARSGFAGIAASSADGTAEFEIDYILIKASGLPAITVAPKTFVQTPVVITNQPQGGTVVECSDFSFAVGVAGNPAPTFQWFHDDSPVLNATNATLAFAGVRAQDAGQYHIIARNVISNVTYSATSSVVTLTITPDTFAPSLLGAQALGLSQVQVQFDQRVSAVTATNRNNYAITNTAGAPLTISEAFLDGSHSNVVLTVSSMTEDASYVVVVNNIVDECPGLNVIAPDSAASFTAVSFTTVSVGNPQPAGTTVSVPGGLNISAGGRDVGGSADEFQFSYQARTGDFDVKVRIESLSLADAWAEAGLMARENLSAGSRFAAAFATPSMGGSFFLHRTTANAAANATGSFPVNYPNLWLRLRRAGNQFTGYAGLDGQHWTTLGSATIALPSTIQLGFAAASHNTNQTTTAAFRDFANVTTAELSDAPLPFEPLGQSSRRTSLVISEIMYNPLDRADGRNLEFVELFNALGEPQDLSGWRLDGEADFTFPPGTVISAGGFLVVAQSPADIETVYGISGVLGPFSNTNSLPNDQGTVQLRNRIGAVFLEANYDTQPPWPIVADGAGHSLVLARPSWGEGNVEAWAVSDRVGGSPGGFDGFTVDPLRNVVINEFRANTDEPERDFIELYNHSNDAIDISGCFLSDARNTNKFVIPQNTVLPPRGFIAFDEVQLGFALGAGGEEIYFRDPANIRVLDAVRFEAQANGISSGRFPDGSPGFQELIAATPGTNNAASLIRDIVINEIMYNPISLESDDEFVELYNRGSNAVNLGGWRLNGGISFSFPANTLIPADGYVVIARNASRLIARYPDLHANNTVGNFNGSLANGGERVSLEMPDAVFTTNNTVVFTNFNYIVADEVTYRDGGRWGRWADGGGSSLELIDARSDNRLAANWAESDETAKAGWTEVSVRGVLDNPNGNVSADQLQVLLQGAGECLIDNVEVLTAAGVNLVANSTFESGAGGWTAEGTQERSGWEPSEGFNSPRSFRVRASDRGDNQVNRIRTPLSPAQPSGTTNTIRARVRWLRGHPEVLFRLRGNWMEAAVTMDLPTNLGTPGARNSRALVNAAPAIHEVTHYPPVPAANEPVVVTARVHDPDGVASLQLRYRIDPSATLTTVTMRDDGAGGDSVAGDGKFSATIPGQNANTLVAFHIRATDGFLPAATATFPDDAPARECLVRFGESVPTGSFPSYRIWMTQATFNTWDTRHNLNNTMNDVTFVLGNHRVIYNVGAVYAGSPYIGPSFDTPTGRRCGYSIEIPADDPFLGDTALQLDWPGGHGNENTAIQEQMAYWIADQIDVAFSHRYFIRLTVNGVTDMQRGGVFEAVLQPGGNFLEQWVPGDSEGDFFKIDRAFEFNDGGGLIADPEPQLRVYSTPDLDHGGLKKNTETYRWMWLKRAYDRANDYTNLFILADVLNATAPEPYTSQTEALVDVDQWMAIFAVEHIINNFDSWGHDIGKNMYTFKPEIGRWQLYMFDLDWLMLVSPNGPGNYTASTGPLFSSDDPTVTRMYNHPPFRRACFRAVDAAVNRAFVAEKYEAAMDAKFNSLVANGITLCDGQALAAPTAVKTWFSQRRTYLVNQLNTVNATFNVNANATVNGNLATVTGTAPVGVANIVVNGNEWPVTWTSVTAWTLRLPLVMATNQLTFLGYDARGNLMPGASNQLTLIYTNALVSSAEGFVVFNEIMPSPSFAGAEYIELFNTSSNFTFDLSGMRVSGIEYEFPPGSFIGPRSFLLLAKDRDAFAAAYGSTLRVFDEFAGTLQANGETLTLFRPGETPAQDVVIDKVRYETQPPWSTNASFTGSSWQVIDPSQDNSRVGNWKAHYAPSVFMPGSTNAGWRFHSVSGTMGSLNRLLIFLSEGGSVFIDDLYLCLGSEPEVGNNYIRNGDFESPLIDDPVLTNSWNISTNNFGTTISTTQKHGGNSSLLLVGGTASGGQLNRSIYQNLSPAPPSGQQCTLSLWFLATDTATNLNVRLLGFPLTPINVNPLITPEMNTPPVAFRTPGTVNTGATNLPAFPALWLNEVQAQNLTGIQDAAGEREPWIELHNSSAQTINLDGLYLTHDDGNLTEWAFPAMASIAPGEFTVVFADGEPGESAANELHTNFRLTTPDGFVALTRIVRGEPQVIDYLNYSAEPDRSFGAFPDGQPFTRLEFSRVTPGGTNDGSSAPIMLFINEWLADNTSASGVADPADNQFEDWFELYNAGTESVDLSGYFLTDNLANPQQFEIPSGYSIPPGGFLLVWADNEPNQNSLEHADLHTSFALARGGESIGLFAPDGRQIDAVTFTNQVTNVSQGRYPDGAASVISMTQLTRRLPNIAPGVSNTAPVLAPIGARFVHAGQTLSFVANASDVEVPPQTLTFTLEAGAPAGALINASNGLFTWNPSASQTPGNYAVTIRVTDNGAPTLSDTETVTITVLAPVGFRGARREGNQLVLAWDTVPGESYRVEYKDDLSAPVWTLLTNLNAAGVSHSISHSLQTPAQRFFRVRLEP